VDYDGPFDQDRVGGHRVDQGGVIGILEAQFLEHLFPAPDHIGGFCIQLPQYGADVVRAGRVLKVEPDIRRVSL
jgi:hypothetical protein